MFLTDIFKTVVGMTLYFEPPCCHIIASGLTESDSGMATRHDNKVRIQLCLRKTDGASFVISKDETPFCQRKLYKVYLMYSYY